MNPRRDPEQSGSDGRLSGPRLNFFSISQHSLDIGINGCANRCELRTIAVAVKKLLAEAAFEFFDTQTDVG